MHWLYLACAVVLEVFGTAQMKYSDGFTKPQASLLTMIAFALSITLAALAFKRIDMGIAYAVWSGMGTVAAVAVGILYFDEPSSLIKLACVALIAIGLIGLNVSS